MKIIKILITASLVFTHVSFAKFRDVVAESGIDFVHYNGMSGSIYFHEMMGAGVALFDYDNDGDLDVYFCQGNMLGNKPISQATFQPKHKLPLSGRLYRNDSKKGQLKFTDVTEQSKIKAYGYGMGVSTVDIDNDGDVDIFLTNFGENQLWINNGNGTFINKTKKSKLSDPNWSIGASFFDYDNDGFLDLYVVNYVDYDISMLVECRSYDGALDYCSPQGYKALKDSLYHNNGDGSFTNVSSRSGITQERDPGLGIVVADFNKDGWQDMYVANDGAPNILWINNHNGGFENKAMETGVAVNMTGIAEASMGVDAADFDNDGDEDLFMTHLNSQTNTLYKNNGKGWFIDAGVSMGVAASSLRYTGFGTSWFDYNNDGYLDLFSANGAVTMESAQVKNKIKHPLNQKNQLWLNLKNGKYKEITNQQDPSFMIQKPSRGSAFGDINNDGAIDIIVSNNAAAPQILLNKIEGKNNWLGLRLFREDLSRVDIGAQIELQVGDKKYYRRVKVDGSYASSSDSRVVVGFPSSAKPIRVKITWSDGITQELDNLELNKYTTIKKANFKIVIDKNEKI